MQPQKYERSVDFTERDGDDTDHSSINAEFDAAASSINQIRTNLSQIQRDDGALKNGIVTADSLDDSAFEAVLGNISQSVAAVQNSATSALTSATTALGARDAAIAAKTTAESARDATIFNANNAGASALAASNSQTAAAASQSAASASQSAASASQTAAAASATSAATSATTATTQAGIATTKATDATTKATEAAASAASALTSKNAAAASAEAASAASIGGTINTVKYTATGGQTSFAIVYEVGFVHVYLNGVKLESGVEFTANNGTSVVLSTGATAGDVVDMIAFGIFSVANTYTKTEADSLLSTKANQSTTYTKTEADSLLSTKANQSTTYTKTEVDSLLGVATPPGTVIHVAKSTAPTGYLKANGAAVSRTTYATLFAAINTTFGSGDGSTTFNVPDLRGEFIRGLDDGRGVDTGRGIGTAQADDIKNHTHALPMTTSGVGWVTGSGGLRYDSALSTGSTGGTETRPRNVALLACIKY